MTPGLMHTLFMPEMFLLTLHQKSTSVRKYLINNYIKLAYSFT